MTAAMPPPTGHVARVDDPVFHRHDVEKFNKKIMASLFA